MHTLKKSSSRSLDDVKYLSRGVSDQGTAEHVAFRTSWSLWNVQPSLDHATPKLWDIMKSWDSLGPARPEISLHYSPYWLEFDAARDWLVICDLIRKSAGQNLRNLRIELSFSLSAAAYSMSKYSNLVPFIMVFALDERCRNLSPPSDQFYIISRNMQLRGHILRLQDILQHYEEVTVSIPTAMLHVTSPQFVIHRPKSPSYLLRDVFMSHTNIPTTPADGDPFHGCTMLPTVGFIATEIALPPASLASLETIIEELGQSRQPLLQLYGNELSKSLRGQLGQDDSQFVGGAIPSHEFLLIYHRECSHRKNKSFSEISAVLSPSQNVEEVSWIAGLWPRITPRSILRQLAQDRISTLPNQWKLAIMRFAVSFLKYQQSLRLLKLSSRQRHEELLWEIEAIRHDVLAESTPDWLLVQVRLLLCCKSNYTKITF